MSVGLPVSETVSPGKIMKTLGLKLVVVVLFPEVLDRVLIESPLITTLTKVFPELGKYEVLLIAELDQLTFPGVTNTGR